MTRKISTRTTWEPVVGYSRAVAAGDFVFVSGCTSVADGVFVHEGDARAQSAQAIANVAEALARLDRDGCRRFVVTDVTKDGTLAGPNLDLLRRVCARTDRPVIASGGVSSLDDLRALATLAPLGVEGAIVGKALYAGAFTLEQALEAVKS